MPLLFNGSNYLTLGVEIELQLIDPATLDLTPKSLTILEKKIPRLKAELHQSMLEIDTPICTNVKQCQESLSNTIAQVRGLCEEMGLFLSISGTHPFQQWSERLLYPSERYKYLEAKFQWLLRRLDVYGMHVHIGVTDGDMAIKLSNALIRYLPLFLALSASSPFWRGIDTGFHSCRSGIIESFPYSGIPPYFADWHEFEKYYDTLIQAGAIGSTKDLYWLVRPNASYGTLEIRVFDGMPTLAEMSALIALTQCLAKSILENPYQERDPYHHWIAPSNLLVASRDGLNGVIVKDKSGLKRSLKKEALSCLEQLAPVAQDLGCLDQLQYIKTILKYGNSGDRQRQVFAETGSLNRVVESIKKEFDNNQIIVF